MTYKTIHTTLGLQLLAQAEATGSTIEITHMAVGDGGGNAIILDPSMKQLTREKFRAPVNRVYQDPENENLFTAELIIPVETDNFVVREIAIFDRNGNMLMIGNTPEVHKPTISDGAFTDSVYRIPFVVSNSESIQLNIDPNTILATHSWIVNTLTTAYFLPGGVTGQVLKKKSNTNGDIEWSDASTAEIFVTTIEEEQTLVTDQTVVDLTTVTTHGAAVYINGDRITNKAGEDGWIATSSTRITLGKSYPNSKILIVQNTPLGSAPYPLAQKNNLSDVLNKPLARQNLGVMSEDEAKFNDCPPGTVIMLAATNIPTGYRLLKCNGATISRTAYANLFSVIGTTFGAGNGVNTFRLPDLRGEFLRAWDDGRGIDAGRVFGSWQTDQFKSHDHDLLNTSAAGTTRGHLFYGDRGTSYIDQSDNVTQKAGGNETRPRNYALLACIRY